MNFTSRENNYKKDRKKWIKNFDDAKAEDKKQENDSHMKNTPNKFGYFGASRTGYTRNSFFYIYKNSTRRDVYNNTVLIQNQLTYLRNNRKLNQQLVRIIQKIVDDSHKRAAAEGKSSQMSLRGSVTHELGLLTNEPDYFKFPTSTPTGKIVNFLSSNKPYGYTPHHLIPMSSFSPEVFTEDDISMLNAEIPITLNHGENLIQLPNDFTAGMIHCLPLHRGGHEAYNIKVRNDMRSIKNLLAKKKDKKCKEGRLPRISIHDELIKYQSIYWNILVNSGKVKIKSVKNVKQNLNDVDVLANFGSSGNSIG